MQLYKCIAGYLPESEGRISVLISVENTGWPLLREENFPPTLVFHHPYMKSVLLTNVICCFSIKHTPVLRGHISGMMWFVCRVEGGVVRRRRKDYAYIHIKDQASFGLKHHTNTLLLEKVKTWLNWKTRGKKDFLF